VEPTQDLALFPAHAMSLAQRPGMIVAEQVKNSVNQEQVEFLVERDLVFTGLPGGCLHANHNVSEDRAIRENREPFPLGKGEHVGRVFSPQVPPVQGPDPSVAYEGNGELGFRKAKV